MPVPSYILYKDYLDHLAYPSEQACRRDGFTYPLDGAMDPFAIDCLAMEESKAVRRLPHKTQVFPDPPNPYIRTRRSHTDEVGALAVSIASVLGLNVELCRAIAIGHDIGHTPYGHYGESVIAELAKSRFTHSTFGVIIAQRIERKGEGLHLTHQTLAGIECHDDNPTTYPSSCPQEYHVVYWADKIAYVAADLNDIERVGFGDIVEMRTMAKPLGNNQREIVDRCRLALVKESADKGTVSFTTSQVAQDFSTLKAWLYENIYQQIDWSSQGQLIRRTHRFLKQCAGFDGYNPAILIALMTDRELSQLQGLFSSTPFPSSSILEDFGVGEIMPYIRGQAINLTNPDLDW